MKTNDPCRSCVDCGRKACQTSKESLYPDYCLTKTASEEERNSIRDYYIDDTENNQIMNAAAKIQAETYGTINRVKETILFAQQMGYQKIGIATHSAVLRFLLLYLGKKQHDIPNGAVFHIVYEDGRFYLANKEKILLLSCCAPCSCAVIKTMAEARQDFSVVFYNPNIRPLAEYEKRRDENKRVCKLYQVPFIELEYDNERWCDIIKGLENEPERGKRCSLCFHMRLKRVMEYAKENGFTAVASVLGVSRYKNLDQVNDMAERAAKETKFPYLEIEGRKNGMQELRAQLIKELELYQQTYCGCKPR